VYGPEADNDDPKFYCKHTIVKAENKKRFQKQEEIHDIQSQTQELNRVNENKFDVIVIIDAKDVRCIKPFSGHVHWSLALDDVKNYVVLEENVFAIILGEESYLFFSSEADKIEECIRQNKKKIQNDKYTNEDLPSTYESVARKVIANTLQQKHNLDIDNICSNVLVVIEPFMYGVVYDQEQLSKDIHGVVSRLVQEIVQL